MTEQERKTARHYISNVDLTKTLGDWTDSRRTAIKSGAPIPPMPDEVAEAALKIATRMSTKYNYAAYTWREDLVATAVLAVVQYVHSFDASKSSNAFAYITQVVTNAFNRFIITEKKQGYISAVIARSTGNYEHLEDHHDDTITAYEAYKETKRVKMQQRKEEQKQVVAA